MTDNARANARRSRRPARAGAAAGIGPHALAVHPACGPNPSRPAVSPTEDPVTAAATSSANSDSDDARAQQPEPRAARSPRPDAGSPQPARPADATTPKPVGCQYSAGAVTWRFVSRPEGVRDRTEHVQGTVLDGLNAFIFGKPCSVCLGQRPRSHARSSIGRKRRDKPVWRRRCKSSTSKG